MRDRIVERTSGHGRRILLTPSATTTASTFALALSLALPTIAVAHRPGRRGATHHRIALHAAKLSTHAHHTLLSYPGDLTAFSARPEFWMTRLSAASAVHPHERLTPRASARGPPDVLDDPQ